MTMRKCNSDISSQGLADHVAIRKYVPDPTARQVKWLKEMLDMARRCGVPEPVGETVMSPAMFQGEVMNKIYSLQMFAGIKSAFALRIKDMNKPTAYEVSGQMELFHPEAYLGGDNKTLREMP